ncbi:phosphatase PAP2 family protein [Streptococcus pneumoniae]|uniref:phosphatase PAP2 family protein n=1 Tax=Streptococcus pneumoniae TaxID=1313 RepID=UPI0005E89AA4|nr:phosphatase PAP2 family protein [Streptococcus pneumoniae]CGF05944.1 phosphatase [Streptococcus pneumoniae]CIR30263.1 phosphatase [Streptococcus pneumoniae]
MKDKQTFLMKGSFALLLFVILGYMVKFYPEMLVNFDQSIQTAIRGDLPDYLTILFRSLTRLIDIPVIITWVVITAFVFYRKRWKIESFFMLGNLALAGLLIVTFKNIYQRPRPAILHLVEEKGFSFPSGHSLAVTLMVGTLIVILSQRIKDQVWRKIVQIVLGLYLVSVLVSRVYLGVHYHLYAQACEERKIYSVFDLEDRILAQDGYEAKWYNWCDGFNQAATLLLKR